MKKLVSTFALVAFAMVLFAAAPAVNTADIIDSNPSTVVLDNDISDFDSPNFDGDKKKKKKRRSKAACSSQCTSTSGKAKSCSSTSGTTSTRSCCPSAAGTGDKKKKAE